MRLKITLIPKEDTPQPINPALMQGFLYGLLRGTDFDSLHDEKRYKYFCFSNIWPYEKNQSLKAGREYNWLVSSPDKRLLDLILEKMDNIENNFSMDYPKNFHTDNLQTDKHQESYRIKGGGMIRFGKFIFILKNIKKFKILSLTENSIIETSTPITISLPEKDFEKYSIELKKIGKQYLYWNKDMALNPFIEGLSKNCIRKFNKYFNQIISEQTQLFQGFRFRGPALVKVSDYSIAASLWDFIPYLSPEAIKILDFCLDCGFGEKSALGFGFVNVKR